MKIIRNGQEWELTPEEMRQAFEEKHKEYLEEDAINQLRFFALNGDTEGVDEGEIEAFRKRYGIPFSELLNRDSEFYMVKKIMDSFEKHSSCNEAENQTYDTIIDKLMREFAKAAAKSRMPEKVAMLDTGCIRKFEMWSNEEWCVEGFGKDSYLNFYIPTVFDVDSAFGINVCTDDNDDYINLYLNWYPNEDRVELIMCYLAPEADEAYEVELTDEQVAELKKVLPELCKSAYGKTHLELWEEALEEGLVYGLT